MPPAIWICKLFKFELLQYICVLLLGYARMLGARHIQITYLAMLCEVVFTTQRGAMMRYVGLFAHQHSVFMPTLTIHYHNDAAFHSVSHNFLLWSFLRRQSEQQKGPICVAGLSHPTTIWKIFHVKSQDREQHQPGLSFMLTDLKQSNKNTVIIEILFPIDQVQGFIN